MDVFSVCAPSLLKGHTPRLIDWLVALPLGNLSPYNSARPGPLADLAAGDTIVIGMSTATGEDNIQSEELAEVASISGNTITLKADLEKDFNVGDQVVWHRPFVDFDDAFILPGLAPKEHMCWGVAKTPHADGMSAKYIYVHTDPIPIPMKKSVYFGVDGMPFFKRINQHFYFQT